APMQIGSRFAYAHHLLCVRTRALCAGWSSAMDRAVLPRGSPVDHRVGFIGLFVKSAKDDTMPNDLRPDVAVEIPFFRVDRRGEAIETRGQSRAVFGHRIPSGTQSMDDGIFASWFWDGTRLAVDNDRYG